MTAVLLMGKEPEHFTFDVSENLVDAMCSSFKALEDEFEFVLEEVIETSLFVFFELMSVPGGSGYSSGSCGGSNNDLPHKKKDDDDELLRATRIAGLQPAVVRARSFVMVMEDTHNYVKVQPYNVMKKHKDAESLFDIAEGQEEKENMTVAGYISK